MLTARLRQLRRLKRRLDEGYSAEERRLEQLIWQYRLDEAKRAIYDSIKAGALSPEDFSRLIDVFRSLSANGQ